MGLLRLTIWVFQSTIDDIWRHMTSIEPHAGSLLLTTPSLILRRGTIEMSNITFERLLAITRLLNFVDFDYGLSVGYDRQVALAACVKGKDIQTLRFYECGMHIGAWIDLFDAQHSQLRCLRYTRITDPDFREYDARMAENITEVVWQDWIRITSIEHPDAFMRTVLSNARLQKLVLHCKPHAQSLLSLVANSLTHLDVAFCGELTIDPRFSNLRCLVLDISDHIYGDHIYVGEQNIVPRHLPQSLLSLKIVCPPAHVFEVCAILHSADRWKTDNMSHLVVSCEPLDHEWPQPPDMCDVVRLQMLCRQLDVSLDITARSGSLVKRGLLHPAVATSCAGCDHAHPA